MPPPLVSVVVATFNSSDTLRLTLASVLSQTLGDFEVLVIGDACTDNSAEVVAQLADERLHWRNLAHNSGNQAVPNNAGVEIARGKYIAFLGHDDLWFPHHLAGLVAHIESTSADWVHSLCAMFTCERNSDGVPLPDTLRVDACGGPPPVGRFYVHCNVPPSTWLFRHELAAKVGTWSQPERLAWNIDFDWLMRVYRSGSSMQCCPQLSVLKFPSPNFRAYNRTGTPPQSLWWEAIQNDAQTAQTDVLSQVAVVCAQKSAENLAPLATFKEAIAACKRRAQYRWGASGVLHPIFRWHFQNKRRRVRRLRGLTD